MMAMLSELQPFLNTPFLIAILYFQNAMNQKFHVFELRLQRLEDRK